MIVMNGACLLVHLRVASIDIDARMSKKKPLCMRSHQAFVSLSAPNWIKILMKGSWLCC